MHVLVGRMDTPSILSSLCWTDWIPDEVEASRFDETDLTSLHCSCIVMSVSSICSCCQTFPVRTCKRLFVKHRKVLSSDRFGCIFDSCATHTLNPASLKLPSSANSVSSSRFQMILALRSSIYSSASSCNIGIVGASGLMTETIFVVFRVLTQP